MAWLRWSFRFPHSLFRPSVFLPRNALISTVRKFWPGPNATIRQDHDARRSAERPSCLRNIPLKNAVPVVSLVHSATLTNSFLLLYQLFEFTVTSCPRIAAPSITISK